MNNNFFFQLVSSSLFWSARVEKIRNGSFLQFKDVWFIPRFHDSLILGYREANGVWIAEAEW